jgi:hypothetical protein
MRKLYCCIMLMLVFATACSSSVVNSFDEPAAPLAEPAPAATQSFGEIGQSDYFERVYTDDMVEAEMAMPEEDLASGNYAGMTAGGEQRPEIIIKWGFVELFTESFDNDKARLESLTRDMGGFIEESNIFNDGGNRSFYVVLRVPRENFPELKKAVEGIGRLISSNEHIQNVTSEYYDTRGRLEVKRIEEERVLEMIENAENIETILMLEEYLGRVRTDIELMESWMSNVDSLAAFSTLTVNMAEGENVRMFANTGNFGQRMLHNFRSSASGTAAFFGNILVFLAGAAIPLALAALLALTGFLAGKKLDVWRRKEGMN